MANVNIAVLIPIEVYLKLAKREIRHSDLKQALKPVDSFDDAKPIKDRQGVYKTFYMPEDWASWYRALERSDRLRFASIIQDRLNQEVQHE